MADYEKHDKVKHYVTKKKLTAEHLSAAIASPRSLPNHRTESADRYDNTQALPRGLPYDSGKFQVLSLDCYFYVPIVWEFSVYWGFSALNPGEILITGLQYIII